MDLEKIKAYVDIATRAYAIGEGLYTNVKAVLAEHAKATLSPEEYDLLEEAWHEDVLRAAANAGLDPVGGKGL